MVTKRLSKIEGLFLPLLLRVGVIFTIGVNELFSKFKKIKDLTTLWFSDMSYRHDYKRLKKKNSFYCATQKNLTPFK